MASFQKTSDKNIAKIVPDRKETSKSDSLFNNCDFDDISWKEAVKSDHFDEIPEPELNRMK